MSTGRCEPRRSCPDVPSGELFHHAETCGETRYPASRHNPRRVMLNAHVGPSGGCGIPARRLSRHPLEHRREAPGSFIIEGIGNLGQGRASGQHRYDGESAHLVAPGLKRQIRFPLQQTRESSRGNGQAPGPLLERAPVPRVIEEHLFHLTKALILQCGEVDRSFVERLVAPPCVKCPA